MFKYFILTSLSLFLLCTDLSAEVSAEIQTVNEAGLPEPDANIFVEETKTAVRSDRNGRAVLRFPSLGFYSLRIVLSDRVISRSVHIRYDLQKIPLFTGIPSSKPIEVQGEKDPIRLSKYTLTQEEIKRLPGAQGDSLKAIQTLPGVFPALSLGLTPTPQFNVNITGQPYRNSDRGDFVFRGAGPRNNQYYFDGMPASYPFHLGNLSSVWNNNIIKDISIYTGAYSSRYGFATGGIIQVTPKNEVRKNTVIWNLNTFLTDVYSETKIGEKEYMLTGVRKSYPNIFLLRTYPQGIPPDSKYADYSDFQWKIGWNFSKEHKVSLVSFGTRDRQAYTKSQADFERDSDGRPDNRPPFGLDRKYYTYGLSYTYSPGDRFSNTLRISRNYFKEIYEVKFDSPVTAETVFGLQNVTEQNLYFAENISSFQIFKFLKLDAGFNYRSRDIRLKADNITSRSSLFADVFDSLLNSSQTFRALVDGDGVYARETAAFSELILEYGGWKVTGGGRFDSYSPASEKRWSPRGAASYTFEKTGTTLTAGSGIYRNSPVGIEQFSRKSGNPYLGMENSEHHAVGISQNFAENYIMKIEGFRNIFNGLITPDEFISDPYARNDYPRDIVNKSAFVQENPLYPKKLLYSNSASGHSEGVEFFLRKAPPQEGLTGWFGWISYSNSITKRNNHQARLTDDEKKDRNVRNSSRRLLAQTKVKSSYLNYYDDGNYEFIFDNDREELYDLDRRHILSLVFGWKFTGGWQIGGRFRYASNLPVTKITGSTRVSQVSTFGLNLYLPKYSDQYNSYRLPTVSQFDL
ncbi:MAG TPA: TonB-dependent receptor, partial [Leptospiraceae bacterium]|nr:TonB-dependent receptor [Leptospiraceae bacterium]